MHARTQAQHPSRPKTPPTNLEADGAGVQRVVGAGELQAGQAGQAGPLLLDALQLLFGLLVLGAGLAALPLLIGWGGGIGG